MNSRLASFPNMSYFRDKVVMQHMLNPVSVCSEFVALALCGRLRLKHDDTRRNQISSFGETDESV